MFEDFFTLLGLLTPLIYLLGIINAVNAIMTARTSQGAIAWTVALITLPYITIPLYWVFGRRRFFGYVSSRRAGDLRINHIAAALALHVYEQDLRSSVGDTPRLKALAQLAKMPFVSRNHARLLINGDDCFGAMFAAIDRADAYILAQFFIIEDDTIGQAFADHLIKRAQAGVRIHLLFDEIGCIDLKKSYLTKLRAHGIHVQAFKTTKGPSNRFQINFRNHRKILLVDGRTAFVGGLNIGDAYVGGDARFGAWRDTNIELQGPAVQCVQLSFIEDWHWATGTIPDLEWRPEPVEGKGQDILVLPTGPADELDSCGLFFVHAIQAAQKRLWIASPYFVPDGSVIAALQLASLRGVDVRIMLPEKADHLLVYLSSFSYLNETEPFGIKFYRYQPGFLHQKVMLVDDQIACVGTANLDNRSFRLNFEITVVSTDQDFAYALEGMMVRDFEQCRRVGSDAFNSRPYLFKLAVRIARLLSPLQ